MNTRWRDFMDRWANTGSDELRWPLAGPNIKSWNAFRKRFVLPPAQELKKTLGGLGNWTCWCKVLGVTRIGHIHVKCPHGSCLLSDGLSPCSQTYIKPPRPAFSDIICKLLCEPNLYSVCRFRYISLPNLWTCTLLPARCLIKSHTFVTLCTITVLFLLHRIESNMIHSNNKRDATTNL